MYASALILSVLFAIPAHAATLNVDELKTLATAEAVDHNLNVNHFLATIGCESGFVADDVGDNGTSFGIVQIHLIAHPDISKSDALNPYFALHWMAEQWSNNNAKIWTCYRQYEKNGYPR